MSLQWTLVATFLYVEIVFMILLLLPFISPTTWNKFFKSRFLRSLENQANLYFTGFLVILVLLFLDSLREMRKYSETREHEIEHGHLDAELQNSMKLFRAQRNFYIAGFALFLYLVVRRLVLLISREAQLLADCEASKRQAKSASDAAQSFLKQNEDKVKNPSASKGGDSTEDDNQGNIKLEKQEQELKKLKQDYAETKEELIRYRVNCESIKKQAESVSKEYDRLLNEHEKLQREYDKVSTGGSTDKKKDI